MICYISDAQHVATAGHSDTSGLVKCHKDRSNLNINIFHVLILRCITDSTRHVGYIREPQGVTAVLNSSGSVEGLVTREKIMKLQLSHTHTHTHTHTNTHTHTHTN
jgi:hypothetical protein